MKLHEFLQQLWDRESAAEVQRYKHPACVAKYRRILRRCANCVRRLAGDGVIDTKAVMPALAFLLGCHSPVTDPETLGRLAQVLTSDRHEADWLVSHALHGRKIAQAMYYFDQPRRLPGRPGKSDPGRPKRDPLLEIEIDSPLDPV